MSGPTYRDEPDPVQPPVYQREYGEYQGPPPTGAHRPPPQSPPPGWSDGYPPYGPYPGYPPPYGTSPYGVGFPADTRPGNALAAAVLGYVSGGLLIIAGMLLLFASSLIANFDNYEGISHGQYIGELTVNGVGNLVAAGLLIAGGISLSSRGT
ncbi:MAG TPA: hypothetical protein VFH38_09740, partial [Jatrophihabitans sp.]|nr:hypothetical protein [Jatrophihabitans sp.]